MKALATRQERLGQYSTKARAQRGARNRTLYPSPSGQKYIVVKCTTWRDLEPLSCWGVVMT